LKKKKQINQGKMALFYGGISRRLYRKVFVYTIQIIFVSKIPIAGRIARKGSISEL
jgi:hypothetical protein